MEDSGIARQAIQWEQLGLEQSLVYVTGTLIFNTAAFIVENCTRDNVILVADITNTGPELITRTRLMLTLKNHGTGRAKLEFFSSGNTIFRQCLCQ